MTSAAPLLLASGSYTHSYGSFRAVGDGLSLLASQADGSLAVEDCLKLPNPAYLHHDPVRDRLFVALEVADTARIAVVAIDRSRRRLSAIAECPLPGTILCFLDVHPSGRWIAGACYGSGDVCVRRIGEDGIPDPAGGDTVLRRGSSVHPVRQASAHPHAARFSPDGKWLVVPDLGTDEVACYAFDATRGTLGPSPRITRSPPGSGPRVPLFDRPGKHLVVVREMACTVTSFAWHEGTLHPIAGLPTLHTPYAGPNTAAGLHWHPSMATLAVSNRGADRLALFRFDATSGTLAPLGEHPTGGAKPRDFAFLPDGHGVVVANQDGDSLAVIDLAQGLRHTCVVRSPSCVRVLPQAT